LNHFRGSELQNYFTKILEDDLKALIKPQYVDQIPKAVKGTVQQLLDKKDERKNQNEICRLLGKPARNITMVYKPGCQVTQTTKYYLVARNIGRFSVFNLRHVTLLAPRILNLLAGFWKIVHL
jgi:hypothetical protein